MPGSLSTHMHNTSCIHKTQAYLRRERAKIPGFEQLLDSSCECIFRQLLQYQPLRIACKELANAMPCAYCSGSLCNMTFKLSGDVIAQATSSEYGSPFAIRFWSIFKYSRPLMGKTLGCSAATGDFKLSMSSRISLHHFWIRLKGMKRAGHSQIEQDLATRGKAHWTGKGTHLPKQR